MISRPKSVAIARAGFILLGGFLLSWLAVHVRSARLAGQLISVRLVSPDQPQEATLRDAAGRVVAGPVTVPSQPLKLAMGEWECEVGGSNVLGRRIGFHLTEEQPDDSVWRLPPDDRILQRRQSPGVNSLATGRFGDEFGFIAAVPEGIRCSSANTLADVWLTRLGAAAAEPAEAVKFPKSFFWPQNAAVVGPDENSDWNFGRKLSRVWLGDPIELNGDHGLDLILACEHQAVVFALDGLSGEVLWVAALEPGDVAAGGGGGRSCDLGGHAAAARNGGRLRSQPRPAQL